MKWNGKKIGDGIMIQKQLPTTLAEAKHRTSANVFNNDTIAGLAVSSYKGNTLKGTAWNSK
jgi:hypothetical protein